MLLLLEIRVELLIINCEMNKELEIFYQERRENIKKQNHKNTEILELILLMKH